MGGVRLRARNMAGQGAVVGGRSGDDYYEDEGEDSLFKEAVEVFGKLKVQGAWTATLRRGARQGPAGGLLGFAAEIRGAAQSLSRVLVVPCYPEAGSCCEA
jgi:hypothetical protein